MLPGKEGRGFLKVPRQCATTVAAARKPWPCRETLPLPHRTSEPAQGLQSSPLPGRVEQGQSALGRGRSEVRPRMGKAGPRLLRFRSRALRVQLRRQSLLAGMARFHRLQSALFGSGMRLYLGDIARGADAPCFVRHSPYGSTHTKNMKMRLWMH